MKKFILSINTIYKKQNHLKLPKILDTGSVSD